jgi:hypothetical protein
MAPLMAGDKLGARGGRLCVHPGGRTGTTPFVLASSACHSCRSTWPSLGSCDDGRRRVLAGTRRVEVGALEGAPPALGGVRRVQAGFPAHVRLIWYFRWVVIIQGIFLQMSHGLMGRHTYQTLYDTTYNHE